MGILQVDEQPLQDAQQTKRKSWDQDTPQDDVDPNGWVEGKFDEKGTTQRQGAQDHDDEHRRSIATLSEAEVETAHAAALAHRQAVIKQRAPAATWAQGAKSIG